MDFYTQSVEKTLTAVNSNATNGLDYSALKQNADKYGYNSLTQKKKKSFFKKVIDALKEPMLIILLFGFAITFGANLGKYLKTGEGDFIECFGILAAVVLSVGITLFMEGSSERAFASLNKIYQNQTVKVIRSGEVVVLDRRFLTVGDIVFLEAGDRIVADGRLIESTSLTVDESALTGESLSVRKDCHKILDKSVVLAERVNCVYSGTFVTGGSGKMVITSVGDHTELGRIAGELNEKQSTTTPLQQKLNKLGKTITGIGATCALIILVISMVRLALVGQFTFNNVQDLLIDCIVLIVAAVPEGLPTIVAMSLALNMIKLASQNALIKKMSATETAGAISIICSDKTGTLTKNQMSVVGICSSQYCVNASKLQNQIFIQNFICNNTAEIVKEGRKTVYKGSGTECALLKACIEKDKGLDYAEYRKNYPITYRLPFSSDNKYMITVIRQEGAYRSLIKGSPETVLLRCKLTSAQKETVLRNISERQKNAERILCFAHLDMERSDENLAERSQNYVYDGFVALADPIRPEVKKAVLDCKKAGIKVKILTGDNVTTAYAVAKQLGIAQNESNVVNALYLESLSDQELKRMLGKINVIARSTPIVKLRVVRALKEMGEVVAVTGDGINDAPAIKHADVGIAMGVAGSEITKETADVVLLDDSFATVVKTVSFGRNVYKNLQRFILFQLSVNLSALLFITICTLLNLPNPFNTLQLLWINVIMDGPPALTLGLNSANDSLMSHKPVKRSDGIVSKGMLLRIMLNALFVCGVMVLQTLTNFLGARQSQLKGVSFTLFILFQLFNAFNSIELGDESILKSVWKNKIMLYTFGGVFLLHVIIVQTCSGLFGVSPVDFITWCKCILTAFSIIVITEIVKLIVRKTRNTNVNLFAKRQINVLKNSTNDG
ncbi:MAG: calcium-translocating P-type ATPase, PMCA-type [Clostridia bacterium]|nr:calcium-translocating P-type ATPase, PMCA-type [Clostridia bacterium]